MKLIWSKKCLSVVTTSMCFLSLLIVPNAQAGLIKVDYIVNVAPNGAGIVTSGKLVVAEDVALVRQSGTTTKKIASFLHFDITELTTEIVSATDFSALFQADLMDNVNGSWAMSVDLGLAAGAPLFGNTGSLLGELVSNVASDSFDSYKLDITNVVRDWVNGDAVNNGLSLFAGTGTNNGAGFNNIGLQIDYTLALQDEGKGTEVPEPATFAIFALGMMGLASRRFTKS